MYSIDTNPTPNEPIQVKNAQGQFGGVYIAGDIGVITKQAISRHKTVLNLNSLLIQVFDDVQALVQSIGPRPSGSSVLLMLVSRV